MAVGGSGRARSGDGPPPWSAARVAAGRSIVPDTRNRLALLARGLIAIAASSAILMAGLFGAVLPAGIRW